MEANREKRKDYGDRLHSEHSEAELKYESKAVIHVNFSCNVAITVEFRRDAMRQSLIIQNFILTIVQNSERNWNGECE